MKINALDVDGFGVWSDLKLDALSDGLNVFHGPNEAGKTTLMQFIRSVLYGFSPERQRYLPPLRGGRPGGSVHVTGPGGRFHVSRYWDEDQAERQPRAVLTSSDGARQGDHVLNSLLCNIDESIFNNVFAVGLQEMQQLGTLGDTEAASMLYNLSAGLDRVSLVEVMRELEASRNRILDHDGGPCQAGQLLAERDRLRGEIEELCGLGNSYGRLAAERDELDREVARLEDDKNHIQRDARSIEIAVVIREQWQQRAALDDQLAALNPPAALPEGTVPEGAVDRLDRINAQLERHRRRIGRVRRGRRQLRSRAAELKIDKNLRRQAARIEALKEQEPWIETLQGRVGELESEIARSEAQLADQQRQLGLAGGPVALPSLTGRVLGSLRREAKAVRHARRQLGESRQQVAAADETARSLAGQIESSLAARGCKDLAGAIDESGDLVAQLRRRVQIDERLDQMGRYENDLEQQSRDLLERQLLPIWIVFALGAVFVVGVVLVMAGLFMPTSITGTMGWALAVLGLAGAGASGAAKVMIERSNARGLEACRKQINMLQLQIKQAKEERESLDQMLPRGGGPIAGRLQTAQAELAALEELSPLDARRKAARREAESAGARVEHAQTELAAARRRWRDALVKNGLPEGLSTKQVRELARRGDHLAQIARRLEHDREELQQRRRELDAVNERIGQLAAASGVSVAGSRPTEVLRELVEQLARQEEHVGQYRTLRGRDRTLRRKQAKHEAAVRLWRSRRRKLLARLGTDSEQEFRQRAVEHARAEVLRRDRQSLQAEIDAAIGGQCSEKEIADQLADSSGEELEARWDALAGQLQTVEARLQQRFEKRGQLGEQLSTVAADSRPAARQLELAVVEKRLQDAIHRWRVLAVTNRVLDSIRTIYEQDRQPETLQEASGYLERLTQGRYTRVWTPLGEDVLRVDDARGESLPVEALSRGTREQLFLSLRLALVSSYARRGVQLPLVLDDVLVNFDTHRAKAAAAVLRDFARAGHQLLVFTCHDHIKKLFKSLKVDVTSLPERASLDEPGNELDDEPEEPEEPLTEEPDEEEWDEEEGSDEEEWDEEEEEDLNGLDDAEAA